MVTVSTPPGVPSVGFSTVVSPCLPSIPRQQHGVTHPSLAGYCQHVEVLLPCNVLVCWVYWLRSSHQADMCHSPPPLHLLLWLGVPNSPRMIISISLAAVQKHCVGWQQVWCISLIPESNSVTSESELHRLVWVEASLTLSMRVKACAVALIRISNHSSTAWEQGGGVWVRSSSFNA